MLIYDINTISMIPNAKSQPIVLINIYTIYLW